MVSKVRSVMVKSEGASEMRAAFLGAPLRRMAGRPPGLHRQQGEKAARG